MLYCIQSIDQIPLEEFKDIVPNAQQKGIDKEERCMVFLDKRCCDRLFI
jgi:hypothetical protein